MGPLRARWRSTRWSKIRRNTQHVAEMLSHATENVKVLRNQSTKFNSLVREP